MSFIVGKELSPLVIYQYMFSFPWKDTVLVCKETELLNAWHSHGQNVVFS